MAEGVQPESNLLRFDPLPKMRTDRFEQDLRSRSGGGRISDSSSPRFVSIGCRSRQRNERLRPIDRFVTSQRSTPVMTQPHLKSRAPFPRELGR
jgi:hypothetical protein